MWKGIKKMALFSVYNFNIFFNIFLVNIHVYDFAEDKYFLQVRTHLDDFSSC